MTDETKAPDPEGSPVAADDAVGPASQAHPGRTGDVVLEAIGVTKTYGATRAVSYTHLDVYKGQAPP